MQTSGSQKESRHDHRNSEGKGRGTDRSVREDRGPGVSGPGERLLARRGDTRGAGVGVSAAAAAGAFVAELARAVAADLESRLSDQIAAAIEANRAPRLLDRRGLAEALGCGLDTVDKLRAEGLPQLLVGDAPRFEFDRVLEWLRERGAK